MSRTSGSRNRGYPQRSGYDRVAKDLYSEPPWCVSILLDALESWGEPLRGKVLDPCCGLGNIVSVVLDRGVDIRGSDIADHGFGDVVDLFTITKPIGTVISNPPYGIAEQCLRHMLTIARQRVILLLRLTFLESRSRYRLFHEHPPVWVAPCPDRPSIPPGAVREERDHNGAFIQPDHTGGTAPYAWFGWQPGYQGPTVIRQLPLRAKPNRARKVSARGTALSAADLHLGQQQQEAAK
jgi:hypothetical protein